MSLLSVLDKERKAIWLEHPEWSDEQRQQAWSGLKAQLDTYFRDDSSTPRHLQKELAGTPLAQAAHPRRPGIDIPGKHRDLQRSGPAGPPAMARSSSSKKSYLRQQMSPASSNQPQRTHSNTSKRTHQQAEMPTPSYTYDSTPWHLTDDTAHYGLDQPMGFQDPGVYVSTMLDPYDHSQITAKRQRVEDFNISPTSYAFDISKSAPVNASPSTTNMSSNLSSYSSCTSSYLMSREDTTDMSLVDELDMLHCDSSLSYGNPFPFDQSEEDLVSSFVSSTTETPSSNLITTSLCERNLLDNVGLVGSEGFSFIESSPATALSSSQGADMSRCSSDQSTSSEDSTSSVSSAEIRANERRRKVIENGRRKIESKSLPEITTTGDIKVRALKPIDPKGKEMIAKQQSYQRPQYPKLMCEHCNEFPLGFRGEHELRRHCDRKHAQERRVWICVDPEVDTTEGWRPAKPLNICKQCKQKKPYNVYYNAAAHLRRAHFNPRKRGRKARGEERVPRAGNSGGNWPPIDWLKANGWLKEVETGPLTSKDEAADHDDIDDEADFDDDDENYEAQDSALETHHLNLAAESLGFEQYHNFDMPYGYPTPGLELTCPQYPQQPLQAAPPMEYAMTAPPAMMTNPNSNYNVNMMMNNNDGSLYSPNGMSFYG